MAKPAHVLLLPETDWMDQALCADHPKVSFFGSNAIEAKAICQKCPVRRPCLDFALATPSGATGASGAGPLGTNVVDCEPRHDRLLRTPPMMVTQARALFDRIKRNADELRRLVVEIHEGKAWEPLGYKSFKVAMQTEFGMSEQHAYRILAQAKVINELAAAAGATNTRVSPSHRQTERIKPKLPEAAAEVKERVEAGEPPERVVPEVIQTYGAPSKIEPGGSPDVEEPVVPVVTAPDYDSGSSAGTGRDAGPASPGATDPKKGQGDEGAEVEGDVGPATARVPDDGPVGQDHGDSAPEPSPAVSKGEEGTTGTTAVAGPAPSSPPARGVGYVDRPFSAGPAFDVALTVFELGRTPDEYAEVANTDDLRVLASWCHRNLAARGFEDPHEVCRAAIADMQRLLDEARGRAA